MSAHERTRPVASVVGSARDGSPSEPAAAALGRALIDAGFRVVTGGLGGVMRAASRGARSSTSYRPGDIIGVLPGYVAADANEFVDVPICSGLHHARNVIVAATGDVLFAVGGRAGTLSEMALAWTLGKPVIAICSEGWAGELSGRPIDDRRDDKVYGPYDDAAEAVGLAIEVLRTHQFRPRDF